MTINMPSDPMPTSPMDFIFMLTRFDKTIADCLDVVEHVADLGLRHLGFKDVGVDMDTLTRLNDAIHETGATSYLEVVSTTRETARESAMLAASIGVDRLLGGTWVEDTLQILDGTATMYFPFVGEPEGHPTRLAGTPASIAADTAHYDELGCAGVDLLAYRATNADPIDLVRAARAASDGYLIVAGSVSTREQIQALAHAGANAFTVGSALFAGDVDARSGLLRNQLAHIIESVG